MTGVFLVDWVAFFWLKVFGDLLKERSLLTTFSTDFARDSEVKTFCAMWRVDKSIGDIATELGWVPLKVGLLIIDKAEKGLIEQRV